jgi:hypothetical protein
VPGVLFARVEDRKAGRNRVHLGLRPDDQYADDARASVPTAGAGD